MREKKPLSEKLAIWCVTLALITITIFDLVVGGYKFMMYVAGAIFLIICFVALINLYYLGSPAHCGRCKTVRNYV